MVAGGGASVIYADTVGDLGFAQELGNYGEYSGGPNTQVWHDALTMRVDHDFSHNGLSHTMDSHNHTRRHTPMHARCSTAQLPTPMDNGEPSSSVAALPTLQTLLPRSRASSRHDDH